MSIPALAQPVTEPSIEILIETAQWGACPEAEDVIRAAITAVAHEIELCAQAEIAVVLTSDDVMRSLNRTWRGKDAPTNVLSFPSAGPSPAGAAMQLGDVVLAYDTIRREAESAAIAFTHHLAHLTVHGVLHLMGYDHESDPNAELMENAERAILARLAIADPYEA